MICKITYHSKLYWGESIKEKNKDKLLKKLEKHPVISGLFVIAISESTHDQLDIYNANILIQKYFQTNPPTVVGIAKSYDESILVVQQILEECLQKTGNCNIKEYLLCGA